MEPTSEERRQVAERLREAAVDDGHISRPYGQQGFQVTLRRIIGTSNPKRPTLYARLADLIEPQPIDGNTSDGYHTFNELYHHRAVLFSVIVENFAARAWKSKLHADGTMYDGMFVVGIETPDGQATYHYDIDPYWDLFRCKEVDRAPEWDGHTPDQAIERIGKLVDCKTDRPTCKNVSGHQDVFECSECRCKVELIAEACNEYGEPFSVAFMPSFCPECGAEVMDDE